MSVWCGFVAVSQAAPTANLECTASVGITCVKNRMHQSNGKGPTTPLRQNQNCMGFENKTLLMGFDARPVKGWEIDKAYLHLYLAKGDLYAVGLCQVMSPWNEGEGENFEEAAGASCWAFARLPKAGAKPEIADWWAWPGSSICSVSWAHPAARYSYAAPAAIEREKVGSDQAIARGGDAGEVEKRFVHLRIPVDTDMIAALAAGVAYGMILTDDKGQVAESRALLGRGTPYVDNDAEDVWAFTRHVMDANLRPRLEVTGTPVDPAKIPAGPRVLKATPSSDPGVSMTFDVQSPADCDGGTVLAYAVKCVSSTAAQGEVSRQIPQWMLPRPAKAGEQQRIVIGNIPTGDWRVQIGAVDRCGRQSWSEEVKVAVPPPKIAKFAAAIRKPAAISEIRAAAEEVFVVPDMVGVDPVSGKVLRDGDVYSDEPDYAVRNSVWDLASRRITLAAMANEVVAFQVIVPKGPKGVEQLKIETGDLKGPGKSIEARNLSAYMMWYVKSPSTLREDVGPGKLEDPTTRPVAWHADACVPLSEPFSTSMSIPSPQNAIEGQTNASIGVDIYVPKDAAAGKYEGTLRLASPSWAAPKELRIVMEVLPAALPDDPTFPIDLNCYGGLAGMAGVSGEGLQTRDAEWKFYALAKQHRLMINVLGYRQNGAVDASRTPVVDGAGADCKVTDWKPFDDSYGGLLDGSAFDPAKGYVGPGAMRPISHMYLPFHENWPLPLEKYYKDYAKMTTRLEFGAWAKTSRPLDEAFGDDYKRGYAAVAREFAEHFARKGWTGTHFQVFLNDKYYYKASFLSGARAGSGASFWLLDESIDYDDYAANRFFLLLAKRGIDAANHDEVHFDYRADVSQPEMTRGLLDNVVNLWMDNLGAMDNGFVTTAQVRQKYIPGETYWFYGGGPGVSAPPVNTMQLLLGQWAEGSSGALPYWTTLGGRDWAKADDMAIYYTGKNYANSGQNYPGPLAGLRMKIMRRCQQDIEIIQLAANKNGWSRAQTRTALAALADDPAAPVLSFGKLTADQQETLRAAARQEAVK